MILAQESQCGDLGRLSARLPRRVYRTPESTAECLIVEDQFLSGPKRVIVIRTSPQASEKFDFYPDIGSGLQKIKKNLLNLLFSALSANSCIMRKRRLHDYQNTKGRPRHPQIPVFDLVLNAANAAILEICESPRSGKAPSRPIQV